MAAAQGMMTIERWLVRMATLEREETRLHREYVRLGTQLHEHSRARTMCLRVGPPSRPCRRHRPPSGTTTRAVPSAARRRACPGRAGWRATPRVRDR